MQIEKAHFIDASEQNADGLYDYYYEGDMYRVIFTDIVYACRSYADEPSKLSFVNYEVEGVVKNFDAIPYADKNFIACVAHFHGLGFMEFMLLADSYTNPPYKPVDLSKVLGR